MHDRIIAAASLVTVLSATVVGGPSSATAQSNAQSPAQLAVRLANQELVRAVTTNLKLSFSYASPIATDQPIEFLIARAVYTSDGGLSQRIEQVRSWLTVYRTLQMQDPTFGVEAAISVGQNMLKFDQSAMYSIESDRNEYLNASIVAELVKASKGLSDVVSVRNILRDRITQALIDRPAVSAAFAGEKPVPDILAKSRSLVVSLIAQASRRQ